MNFYIELFDISKEFKNSNLIRHFLILYLVVSLSLLSQYMSNGRVEDSFSPVLSE